MATGAGRLRSVPPSVTRLTLSLLALVVAALLALTGTGRGLEDQLQIARNSLRAHDASPDLTLVEIDARSLAAFSRWPWPRSLHAKAVQELERLEARTIAFDVDFSSNSAPAEDAALAEALAAARTPVILPTFRQQASHTGSDWVENLPIAPFREHAMLGSVNVTTDPDGFVRPLLLGVVTDGEARPTIAALLSSSSGAIDKPLAIDWSLNPGSITRVSYVDLVEGRAPRSAIAGRSVLIGATAVEMGDRYAVPGHGVLPGSVIQLVAAETLANGSSPVRRGPFPALALAALLAMILRARSANPLPLLGVTAAAILALPLGTEWLHWGSLDIVPALAYLAAVAAIAYTQKVSARIEAGQLHDLATGLPNALAMARETVAADSRIEAFAIANFDDIAAVVGHERAAVLVTRVVERLRAIEVEQVFRVEPGVLAWFAEDRTAEDAEDHLKGLVALFAKPVELDGKGILVLPRVAASGEFADAAQGIEQARMALQRAARSGLRWGIHQPEYGHEARSRLALAADLDKGMLSGEIWAAFQPKLDIASGRVTAFEALARWTRPDGSIVPVDTLVSVVEEASKMRGFTLHVLREALAAQRDWMAQGHAVGVAVNVSSTLPSDPDFVTDVQRMLLEFPEAIGRLTFEITETAVMANTDTVVAALEHFSSLGIAISIDDYGTGQSSLTYLRRLPASEIKIDMSFITNLLASDSDRKLVRSTIELARELGCKVVAEGVEDPTTLALLGEYGCHIAQGWLVGRPMRSDQALGYLAEARGDAAQAVQPMARG